MRKDRTILGTPFQSDLSMMCAELDEEQRKLYSQRTILESLQATLEKCDSCPGVVTYTTQDDRTKPIITVTFSVPRKILEKNGAT